MVSVHLRRYTPMPVDSSVESKAGATTVGYGGGSVAFASGLNPAPSITFPGPAHRTRRTAFPYWTLQCDHASCTRETGASSIGRTSGSPIPQYKLGQALAILTLMIANAIFLRPIGFILATTLFLGAGAHVLGER